MVIHHSRPFVLLLIRFIRVYPARHQLAVNCHRAGHVRCCTTTPWHMQGDQYYYKPLSAKTPYYWIAVRCCDAA